MRTIKTKEIVIHLQAPTFPKKSKSKFCYEKFLTAGKNNINTQ